MRASIAVVAACYMGVERLGGAVVAAVKKCPTTEGTGDDSLNYKFRVWRRLAYSEPYSLVIPVRGGA